MKTGLVSKNEIIFGAALFVALLLVGVAIKGFYGQVPKCFEVCKKESMLA